MRWTVRDPAALTAALPGGDALAGADPGPEPQARIVMKNLDGSDLLRAAELPTVSPAQALLRELARMRLPRRTPPDR
jgi:hypothetical protein